VFWLILDQSQNFHYWQKWWKSVLTQLQSFVDSNEICEVFQSGFKKHQSTESASLRVFNWYFSSDWSWKCYCTFIFISDGSVWYNRPSNTYISSWNICGNALRWIKSCFQNRSFSFRTGEFVPALAPISCGAPQGSVLAPFYFHCICYC